MKKILYSVFSAVALLSIAACSNNDDELDGGLNMGGTPNPNVPTTIIATTESSATTRTALQGDDANGYDVVWSEGDKITLQGSDNPTVYASVDYALQEGAGTTEGKFAPVASAVDWAQCSKVEAFYAVKDMQWPAVQQYYGEDVISNAPMYCSVDNHHTVPNLSFKNMGGILRLTLKGIRSIKRIEITSPNKAICGTITGISSLGTATIDANGSKTITLQMNENVQLNTGGKVFNIAMPSSGSTGYANVQIRIVDENDNEIVKTMKTGKNLVILRSTITDVSITIDATTGTAKRTGDIDVNWVQLWKDGPKFAEYNVGGPDDTVFYTWGANTTSNDPYDAIETLSGNHDTATSYWGSNWRMPTKEEFVALYEHCDFRWEDNGDGCYLIGKGAFSSNSIYLPAYVYGDPDDRSIRYWSSTPCTLLSAWALLFYKVFWMGYKGHEENMLVRAVLNEQPQ